MSEPQTSIPSSAVEHILASMQAVFPGWDSCQDPRFQKHEVQYKRAAVELAQGLLGRSALDALISTEDTPAAFDRIRRVARATNLLYQAHPKTGDLAVLEHTGLDRPGFLRAFRDLLHGGGDPPERLDDFSSWLEERGCPNKWTFNTYFLFLVDPENNLFIKPQASQRFFRRLGWDVRFSGAPDKATYRKALDLMRTLAEAMPGRGIQDFVDLHSILWVVASWAQGRAGSGPSKEEARTFASLLEEFAAVVEERPEWKERLHGYDDRRQEIRGKFERVLKVEETGGDLVTPMRSLLQPLSGPDLKTRLEAGGLVRPEHWPEISSDLLRFLKEVSDDPDRLPEASDRLVDSPFAEVYETHLLSPVLNALVPDQFLRISHRSRAVVNHFLGLSHGDSLKDYSELNGSGHYLIARFREDLQDSLPEGVAPHDGFDAFADWLMGEKGYTVGDPDVWKVDIPSDPLWGTCWKGGFVGVAGAEEVDLGGLSDEEWESAQASLFEERDDLSPRVLADLRTFANQIVQGDWVVAAKGTDRVLGIGRVVGPYEHHPGDALPHRVRVEWLETDPRKVSEPTWKRVVQMLDRDRLKRIREIRPETEGRDDAAFPPEAFQLLQGLSADPTREFYLNRKDAFQEHLIDPFQTLLRGVGALLPTPMKEALETENRLFSRIPKNDYGRGGAWPFYWGAFYPRGEKRTESPQLYLAMHGQELDFGFSLGSYSEEATSRFLASTRQRKAALEELLKESLDGMGLVFGGSEEDIDRGEVGAGGDFVSWLSDAEAGRIRVRVVIAAEEVLQTEEVELRERIRDTFIRLFPLMLMAIHEDPIPSITDFLGLGAEEVEEHPEYSLEEVSAKTGLGVALLNSWVAAIQRKGQAILYGPPGTGKTFLAEHLARHLVGGGDGVRELIQFHPAYEYEDFIQGLRPDPRDNGQLAFKRVAGRFLTFCRQAQGRSGTSVLIIDEINRANLSRVFGELMYLLEYRDQSVRLSSGDSFRIPASVRILGTMNTADRSIALVDHALRRRFAFLHLRPDFEVLKRHHEVEGRSVDGLIRVLKRINGEIRDPHYHLGITFFLNTRLGHELEAIWRMEIEPYLEEFFFDAKGTVDQFRWERVREEVLE